MEQQNAFVTELLDSGVQVVGQPMLGVESVAVGILIGAGARDEEPRQFGITHFTEQMLFRGTQHLDARQLSDRFDARGISYDTSSSLEISIVNAVLLATQLREALDLMMDVVRFPLFPANDLDNVRTLLVQEIRQREDQPAQRAFDSVRQFLFAGSPLGHDVLGTEETLRSITRDDLVAYWSDRYTPNNTIISIAGKFDWCQVVEQLQRLTMNWPSGSGRLLMQEPSTHSGVKAIERDLAQENIGFAFPAVSFTDPHYYAAALFAQALGGSSNSRLFREVREKRGLAYAVQARFDGLEKAGMIRIYVGTSAEQAHESVQVILEELHKIEMHGITPEELALSKTRLKSQLVMRSESTSARMLANARTWWFEEQLRTLEEVKDRIDRVSVEEVLALVRRLQITDNLAAVGLGPRSEAELFGGILATP